MIAKMAIRPFGHGLSIAGNDLRFTVVVVSIMLCKLRENGVHEIDYDRRTAIALDQFFLTDVIDLLTHRFKDFGNATAPTVDRLFTVSNTKERLVLGRACDDRFSERLDNVPLHWRSVLKLV